MGSIRSRQGTGQLFFDFRHEGLRCREQTALPDTPANRKRLEKVLERIEADIKLGNFEYAKYFPGSKMIAKLAVLSGSDEKKAPATLPSDPSSVMELAQRLLAGQLSAGGLPGSPVVGTPAFASFAEDWQSENKVLWRRSYQTTIADIVRKHLVPAFGGKGVGVISREEILKFRSELAKVKGRKKETLSPRRINAIMNVLGLILKECLRPL